MVGDAELLSRWRTLGARHSEEVLELAPRVLKSGNLGEQGQSGMKDRAGHPTDSGRMGSPGTTSYSVIGSGTYIYRHSKSTFTLSNRYVVVS